jgi:hypothetical protein
MGLQGCAYPEKDSVMARKPPKIAPPPDVPFRSISVRMPTPMHEQLRELAFQTRIPQHTLIIEGINLMFRRYGRDTVAASAA